MKEFICNPVEIEKESMAIIGEILGEVDFTPKELKVVKRVIHTTADFEYAQLLEFNHAPLEALWQAIRDGRHLVTDTGMAMSGINRRVLSKYGAEVKCFMSQEEVALEAKERGLTRAMVSMEHAVKDERNGIYVIGNAPTALMQLLELIEKGQAAPAVIIGVPVGFVGAAESKERLGQTAIPHILIRGRKGGSNVAASIVNAISYMLEE
ncbi:MAG: precorrin-8X methylmutase [Desulfitobacteriaceae bacterium]|nr:precorrin-8X methylmutase [Clostridia bacterium]MDD4346651.1 precorrin-8X methylmutase [Desulfitobacteriaceae bacterium]